MFGAKPTDAELNSALASAYSAEIAGNLHTARTLVARVATTLVGRAAHLRVLEWRARLEVALGDLAQADETLSNAQEAAGRNGQPATAFHIHIVRVQVARRASDLTRARRLLAELRSHRGACPAWQLPAPGLGTNADGLSIGNRELVYQITIWLRALHFEEPRGPTVASLCVEAALVIAELWAEHGKYRSALALVTEVEDQLHAARDTVALEGVRLLQAEWLLADGQLGDADRRLASLMFTGLLENIRVAIVRCRLALARGRLAEALSYMRILEAVSSADRELYTAAMVMRVTVMTELNQLSEAERLAGEGIAVLGGTHSVAPLVARLERAGRGAAARARSVVALWELPYAASGNRELANLGGELVSVQSEWVMEANRVVAELERGALDAAASRRAKLVQIASQIESKYISLRARFLCTLVDYYTCGPTAATLDDLRQIADQLHAMGARLFEAQVLRFASWAAARCDRLGEYIELARRAATLIDSIARELTEPGRSLFLLNKWSGRDEMVAGRMHEVLNPARRRPATRRELCRVFREVDELTHWPIDRALGEKGPELAVNATSDRVERWVRDRLSNTAARRRASALSPLRLWWFPPKTLVLYYHVLADRTYLFRIARRHIDVMELPIGRVQLPRNPRGLVGDAEAMSQLAEDLGVTRAMSRFPDTERLLIVPHDAIASIPFASLRVNGVILCERVTIAQLDRIRRRRSGPARHSLHRMVSVGLTNYAGSGLPDLPAAEAEADAVIAALGGLGSLRVGTLASKSTVIASLPGATYWHVAAHGSCNSSDPASNGVVLRGGAGFETLTLRDLRGLDLRAMKLASLASCFSAASVQLPGRERICLPTALLDAGVHGVIACLWRVHDEAARELMTELYACLRGGARAADALRMIQSRWHRRGLQPETWAGFVYYGYD